MTTTINSDDEINLASQIKNGNKEAYRQFYNLYSKKVYGFAYSYLKSASEAEEVIQVVFVKIWENRSEINDDLSLQSYLYKITINHIYNIFKFKKVRATAHNDQLLLGEKSDNSTLENIYFNNLQENINILIEELPEQRKMIFKLSRIKGLSHEEIAKKMAISVRTVESQVYKTLKFLKKNLNEDLFIIFIILFN